MKVLLVALMGIVMLGLSGCTPVGMAVGGAAAAGVVIAEERSVEDAVADAGTKLEIVNKLLQESETLFIAVSTSVIEGRVLVTGEVESDAVREKVSELIWTIKSVKAVINELQISSKSDLGSTAEDTWITTKLKARLLQDISIKHVNYQIDTVNRVVYLFGISQNADELERVDRHSRDVAGVRKVVRHVVDKKDRPKKQ